MAQKKLKIEYIPTIKESLINFFKPMWVQTVFVLTVAIGLSIIAAQIYQAQHFGILATVIPGALILTYLIYLALAFYQTQNGISISIHTDEIKIHKAGQGKVILKWNQLKGVNLSEIGVSIFTEKDIVSIPIRAFEADEDPSIFIEQIKSLSLAAGQDKIWFDIEKSKNKE